MPKGSGLRCEKKKKMNQIELETVKDTLYNNGKFNCKERVLSETKLMILLVVLNLFNRKFYKCLFRAIYSVDKCNRFVYIDSQVDKIIRWWMR